MAAVNKVVTMSTGTKLQLSIMTPDKAGLVKPSGLLVVQPAKLLLASRRGKLATNMFILIDLIND